MKIIIVLLRVHISGTGKNVSAYIIDTGIFPSNKFFAGRASVAYDALKDGHKVWCGDLHF